jgi:hypothetical protein
MQQQQKSHEIDGTKTFSMSLLLLLLLLFLSRHNVIFFSVEKSIH